jgi:hypothetical protein
VSCDELSPLTIFKVWDSVSWVSIAGYKISKNFLTAVVAFEEESSNFTLLVTVDHELFTATSATQ